MRPLISVVIPSYNHAQFLARALRSLQEQTYTNWEAIVVDNHSKDNTDAVFAAFDDARIRLLKIHNNGIIAASRNRGIADANGEWIAFLDSDDAWTPDKLEACVQAIEEGADLVYHDLQVIREGPSRFERDRLRTRRLRTPVLLDLLINDNAINNSSVVVRKELLRQIGGLDEDPAMAGAEDYNAWMRVAILTEKFRYLPKVLGYYQVHAQSISRKDMTGCYRSAIAPFMSRLGAKQQNRIRGTLAYMKAKHHYLNGRRDAAIKELRAAKNLGSLKIKIKMFLLTSLVGLGKLFGRK
jgi:glycosyltransferase involved in cell wall biosynthesis